MKPIEQIFPSLAASFDIQQINPLVMLEDELEIALSIFWSTAGRMLQTSGINLLDPPDGYYSLEKNFFSVLFLYTYRRAGIPRPRRIIYATLNQCLRGMVTGCDNILDDEYKKTLETDLPEQGLRFRSVLDIMVSDRILFEVLLEAHKNNEISLSDVLKVNDASLHALTRSGAQEASEENGNLDILHPGQILKTAHHYKTGLLFQSPWAIPLAIESFEKNKVNWILDALYKIGMGCQILDDMVDLASDLNRRHHNYVASVIYHECDSSHWKRLRSYRSSNSGIIEEVNLGSKFPEALAVVQKRACTFLEEGLSGLFGSDNLHYVRPAMSFLAKRIGADRFLVPLDK